MTAQPSKQPTHRLYVIKQRGTKNARCFEIGAAWPNKHGKGYCLFFEHEPRGMIVTMREIKHAKGGQS